MSQREIPDSLVEKMRDFLAEDGIKLFQEYQKEHGTVSPVFSVKIGRQTIPHPVHFREGMQIRNFMRGCDECKDWGDHALDDTWAAVVEKAIQ